MLQEDGGHCDCAALANAVVYGGMDHVPKNCRSRLCSTEADALCLLMLVFVSSSSMSRFWLLALPNFRLPLCLDRCPAGWLDCLPDLFEP